MNFKEMCAQKRTEKDHYIAVKREALGWLGETLGVLQKIPRLNLQVVGPDIVNVLLGTEIIWKFKIETGYLLVTSLFTRWRLTCDGKSYHVAVSEHAPRESSSFYQIEQGVKGHKELRESIQFWLAQMIVDNDWDQTTTT